MALDFQVKCEEPDDTVRIIVWVKTAEITNHDLVEYIRENIVPEAIKNDYNRNYDFLEIFDSPLSTQDTIFVIAIRPSCPNVKKEILASPDIYQVNIDNIYFHIRPEARRQSWFKPLPNEKLFGRIKYRKGDLEFVYFCEDSLVIIRLLSTPNGLKFLSQNTFYNYTEWFKKNDEEETLDLQRQTRIRYEDEAEKTFKDNLELDIPKIFKR